MNGRRRRAWIITGALALVLSLVGCTSATPDSPASSPGPEPGSAAPADPPPAATPDVLCGLATGTGSIVTLVTDDQVRIDAAVAGSGPRAVVLIHEYPADLCGFWPYAVYLSKHGFAVVDLDLRCFGHSTCPADAQRRGAFTEDLVAGANYARTHGATAVALLGASMGGTVALAAAPDVRPTAVVCLACHTAFEPTVGGTPVSLDVSAVVPTLRMPVLFAAGADDRRLKPGEIEGLARRSGSPDSRLLVLHGSLASLHGWDLLAPPGSDRWTSVAGSVAAFLRKWT